MCIRDRYRLQTLNDLSIPSGKSVPITIIILRVDICLCISHLSVIYFFQYIFPLQIINTQRNNIGLLYVTGAEQTVDCLLYTSAAPAPVLFRGTSGV